MLKRRGEGLPITMIIIAIIVLVTALIIILGFKHWFGKGLGEFGSNQAKAKDCDKDGVVDFFDQCPNLRGTDANNGCPPSQTTPTLSGNDCLKEK